MSYERPKDYSRDFLIDYVEDRVAKWKLMRLNSSCTNGDYGCQLLEDRIDHWEGLFE